MSLIAAGQTRTGGTISGQVSNAATRSYLEGAVVEIEGSRLSTVCASPDISDTRWACCYLVS